MAPPSVFHFLRIESYVPSALTALRASTMASPNAVSSF
jgi:hypothetical protein